MMMMMMIIVVMMVGTRLLNGGSSPRLGGRQPTLRADGFSLFLKSRIVTIRSTWPLASLPIQANSKNIVCGLKVRRVDLD